MSGTYFWIYASPFPPSIVGTRIPFDGRNCFTLQHQEIAQADGALDPQWKRDLTKFPTKTHLNINLRIYTRKICLATSAVVAIQRPLSLLFSNGTNTTLQSRLTNHIELQ